MCEISRKKLSMFTIKKEKENSLLDACPILVKISQLSYEMKLLSFPAQICKTDNNSQSTLTIKQTQAAIWQTRLKLRTGNLVKAEHEHLRRQLQSKNHIRTLSLLSRRSYDYSPISISSVPATYCRLFSKKLAIWIGTLVRWKQSLLKEHALQLSDYAETRSQEDNANLHYLKKDEIILHARCIADDQTVFILSEFTDSYFYMLAID